jgi:glycosyltransferase involved in cell wall biosynthesis
MKILYLTFHFEPDLSAGSFRNTALVNELALQLGSDDEIHVYTTQPNRYKSYKVTASGYEERTGPRGCLVKINRVSIPSHNNGLADQIRSFATYFRLVFYLNRDKHYDLILASSSKLFTAFLGAWLARRKSSRKQSVPLFLDIRDLFRENILEMLMYRPFYVQPFRLALKPVLAILERYTFGRAKHINLVSEGFSSYFKPFSQATYSYCTNGIDDEFLTIPVSAKNTNSHSRTVLYAGNIGEGQGLHKIIPEAAQRLGNSYRFVVIGDGGAKAKLEQAVRSKGIDNVEIHSSTDRNKLLGEYQKADYLFVHLNDYKAFNLVLPSKLFEYAATDKPIVAGVAGYAADFIREHVKNHMLHEPGDVDGLVRLLKETPYQTQVRPEFARKFQRKAIMPVLVRHIIQTVT